MAMEINSGEMNEALHSLGEQLVMQTVETARWKARYKMVEAANKGVLDRIELLGLTSAVFGSQTDEVAPDGTGDGSPIEEGTDATASS